MNALHLLAEGMGYVGIGVLMVPILTLGGFALLAYLRALWRHT